MQIILPASSAVFCALVLFAGQLKAQTNLTVAADGSAQFKSVQEAIMSVPSGSRENPVVIHIKPGIYKELIYVQREKCFFKLVGDNATNTILTFHLFAGLTNFDDNPIGTFRTPSTTIDADDFTAENLTFENSAGNAGQALAIRVDGDRAVFATAVFSAGRTRFCSIAGATILKIARSPARWISFSARRRRGLRNARSTVSAAVTSPPLRRRLTSPLASFFPIAESPAKIPT